MKASCNWIDLLAVSLVQINSCVLRISRPCPANPALKAKTATSHIRRFSIYNNKTKQSASSMHYKHRPSVNSRGKIPRYITWGKGIHRENIWPWPGVVSTLMIITFVNMARYVQFYGQDNTEMTFSENCATTTLGGQSSPMWTNGRRYRYIYLLASQTTPHDPLRELISLSVI